MSVAMRLNRTSFRFDIIVWPFLRLLKEAWRPKRTSAALFAVRDFDLYLTSIAKHHSSFIAGKVGKDLFHRGKRLALRCPVLEQTGPFWFKTARLGVLPRSLWRIERMLASDSNANRVVALTILNLFRLVNHKPMPQYDSILSPPLTDGGPTSLDPLEKLIREFHLSRVRVRRRFDPTSVWMGSKGPYSQVSVFSADLDALTLLKEEFTVQREAVWTLTSRFYPAGRAKWDKWLRTLSFVAGLGLPRSPTVDKKRSRLTGGFVFALAKYVFISEGGGKSRGVTPFNYFVQVALKPYHDALMEILRLIPMDCSFDEAKGVRIITHWTRQNRRVYSVDLTDATDRYPRSQERRVIERVFGSTVADAWEQLVSLPILMGRNRRGFHSFSAGAPMGVYCLWPAFSLSNHADVQLAASRAGILGVYRGYVLRGDDVVIRDELVALAYVRILAERGVTASYNKTFDARRDGPGKAEFAKRIFLGGKEFTPISAKQLSVCRIVDPVSSLSIIGRTCDILSEKSVKQMFLPSVLTWFVPQRQTRENLLEYLSFERHRSLRSSLPISLRPDPGETSGITDAGYLCGLRYAHSLALKDLLASLSDETRLALIRMIQSGHWHHSLTTLLEKEHPVFKSISKLEADLAALDPEMLSPAPNFHASRVLEVLRNLKDRGKGPSLSRRTARMQVASKYSLPLKKMALDASYYLPREWFG